MNFYENILLALPFAAAAGFLAGLLGIGGGMLTVPIIVFLLQNSTDKLMYLQQIAIGTTFAIMVFTASTSAFSHYRRGSVKLNIVKTAIVPIILGTLTGSLISPYIPSLYLQLMFIVFLSAVGIRAVLQINQSEPKSEITASPALIRTVTGTIALLSSWIGIAGGVMFVSFLTRLNINIKQSIGTSAAFGLPIAMTGAVMYLVSGLRFSAVLPPHTLGFIHIPYFFSLVIFTVLFAPLGVKVSNKANPRVLKILFALLVLTIAAKMGWNLYIRS